MAGISSFPEPATLGGGGMAQPVPAPVVDAATTGPALGTRGPSVR